MRIAITGTHSVGKSTLVQDFVRVHPDFILEPEPYRTLRNTYPIKLAKSATRLCNGIQFFYNLSRIKQYSSDVDNVIFDRCPIDYIAYSQYAANYGETDIDTEFIRSLIPATREALQFIDYILFIPLNPDHPIQLEDDGIRPTELSYREEVDSIFKQIFYEDFYNVLDADAKLKLVEIYGDRDARIQKINQILFPKI